MKLKIENIADRGVPNEERLHLRVVEPTNLGSHLVMLSAWVNSTAVANGSRAVFWFPPQEVRPNDEIILYTRAGNFERRSPALIGSTTYFYFWGMPNTLWNNPDSCALIFDVASWVASSNLNALGQLAQVAAGVPTHPGARSFGEAIAAAQAANNPLKAVLTRYGEGKAHGLFSSDEDNPFGTI